jgi:hypothetical protein
MHNLNRTTGIGMSNLNRKHGSNNNGRRSRFCRLSGYFSGRLKGKSRERRAPCLMT